MKYSDESWRAERKKLSEYALIKSAGIVTRDGRELSIN